MEKVKNLIDAGASVSMAIKDSLGMTMTAFTDKYDLPRTAAVESVNGVRRATDRLIDALVAELGGSHAEWRDVLQMGRVARIQAEAA